MTEEDLGISKEMISAYLNASSETELFVRGALYLEYIIDKTLERKFSIPSKILEDREFTFSLKQKILETSGYLVDPYKKNVELIGRIRNKFAHSLNPNDQSIEDMIKSMKPTPAMSINESRVTKYHRYSGIAIATISELNTALKFDRPLFVKSQQ